MERHQSGYTKGIHSRDYQTLDRGMSNKSTKCSKQHLSILECGMSSQTDIRSKTFGIQSANFGPVVSWICDIVVGVQLTEAA